MPENNKQTVFDIIRFALITLIIVIPVRAYVAQPFIVSGVSMDPTFENGEYLIVDEFSYHFRTPERGEVIVFRYPKDPSKFFIKRVIGLPGETVEIENDHVSVVGTNNVDVVLDEPYLTVPPLYVPKSIKLGATEYFVMGDNRSMSLDSRSWGPVTIQHIKGRVGVRLFPITEAEILPGDYSNQIKTTK
ncbi:MAG: signal peptidase I [Patescibacteria group bacterium]